MLKQKSEMINSTDTPTCTGFTVVERGGIDIKSEATR